MASSTRVTPNAGELGGEQRLLPAGRHERLGGQIVDLVRLRAADGFVQGRLVQEVGLHQFDVVPRCPMRQKFSDADLRTTPHTR